MHESGVGERVWERLCFFYIFVFSLITLRSQ